MEKVLVLHRDVEKRNIKAAIIEWREMMRSYYGPQWKKRTAHQKGWANIQVVEK